MSALITAAQPRPAYGGFRGKPFRGALAALASLLMLVLAGCGSLPSAPQRQASLALPAQADSALAQTAARSTPEPGLTGVRLLPLGLHALDARLQLIDRARHSLDVKYYVFDNDTTGRLLMHHLARAAARGVRVRLLVDDLYTTHSDELLRSMAALPGIEVRVFNPFCCARRSGLVGRFAASLFDVYRLNHRMHNKLLVADGAMAITGGRNIADDYFQRGTQHHFIDLDALFVGAVVPDLAATFDRYWNSTQVLPIEALSPSDLSAQAHAVHFAALTADARAAPALVLPATDPMGYRPLGDELAGGRLGLIKGRALVLVDPPDKYVRDADRAWKDSLAYQALMKIWTAKEEVTITSPYLIPGPLGIAAFEALGQRKVRVKVLTNSLAATDEPLVHTGYSRYRPQLLDAGVELYELSPSRARQGQERRLGILSASSGRLHAKTAVVDGDKSFIGTMNLDPRSRTQNTELGVFVESAELAREMQRVIDASSLRSAYRVQRAPDSGALRWVAIDEEQRQTVLDSEPESTFWLQLQNTVLGWLVPEQLL
jgi:cardiolipin synthase C